jgi:hypothetical protein
LAGLCAFTPGRATGWKNAGPSAWRVDNEARDIDRLCRDPRLGATVELARDSTGLAILASVCRGTDETVPTARRSSS